MTCGFMLRMNDQWGPVENVERGVDVVHERPADDFLSVGGVRHDQRARRAARTWTVGLGSLGGPESVAALMVAAQGDGGDVMLWDEAAARANMIDPVAVAAREGYPIVDCDGIALRSITQGPSAGLTKTTTVEIPATANAWIRAEGGGVAGRGLRVYADISTDSLLRFDIPTDPPGELELVGAHLILEAKPGTPQPGLDAYAANTSWVEPAIDNEAATYWTTVPTEALLGSAVYVNGGWAIPLGDISAFEGAPFAVRVQTDDGRADPYDRNAAVGAPRLRLTYAVLEAPRVFTQHFPAGDYYCSFWTDAPSGTLFANRAAIIDGALVNAPWEIPTQSGTGWRRIDVPFNVAFDLDITITLYDSTDHLLGGFMLSTLENEHYLPGQKTPVRVTVEDPTFTMQRLYAGGHGSGDRSVVIREVGA